MTLPRLTRITARIALAAATLLVPVASAQARAGGGSGGFGGGFRGGRGGGGHGGGFFVFYFLFAHPILLVLIALCAVGAWLFGTVQDGRYRSRRKARQRRVELAAAEASEDDPAFAPDVVRQGAVALFGDIQVAWDKRDRARLAELVGPDLLVEWNRRLDDFARRGWHNRVAVAAGPAVEYVGLVNREDDRDDRVVVRIEAVLRDWVQDRIGRRLARDDSGSDAREVAEYWTLGKREGDGAWRLLSIEQRAEGDHQLDEGLVATPWGDTERLHDAALVEGAAADKLPEGVTTAEVASVGYDDDARGAALDLSLADGRFAPAVLEVAVRRAIAAWVEAVDGSDQDLAALASPAALRDLLHPGDPSGRTRLVVRGPRLLEVSIADLDAQTEPPRMTLAFTAEGRRYVEDRDTTDVVSGNQSVATRFSERWTFALDGPDESPWRIVDTAAAGAVARRS